MVLGSGAADYHKPIAIGPDSMLVNGFLEVRPKNGIPNGVFNTFLATANATVSVISITGKGILYGGRAGSGGVGSQKTDIYYLYIDGNLIGGAEFRTHDAWNLTSLYCSPFHILKYDDVFFEYMLGIIPGITFESSFEVFYEEKNGRTPSISVEVIYALMP